MREKDLPARSVLALLRRIVARAGGERLLVNDRFDLALAAGCAGVHLTTTSMPVKVVRRIAPGLVIAASTHTLDEALRAEAEGADFVVFGPVYPTPSKLAFGPPVGTAALTRVRRRLSIPVYALGGIRWSNVRELLASGCRHVAGISLFMRSADVAGILRRITRCLPSS